MTSLDERLAALPANRQALLAKLLAERRAATRPEIPRGEGPQPLSFAQWQFHFLWQQDTDSGLYNVPMALRLRGELRAAEAEVALQEVVRRHEILRTRYVIHGDEPGTALGDHQDLRLTHTDLSTRPEDEREPAARALAADFAALPFDLEHDLPLRAALIELADEDHVLVIVVHHIATDGASTELLFREFSAVYGALCSGGQATLPALPIQYADYAGWQRSQTEGERLERGLVFWEAWLEGAETSLDLPTDRPRPAKPTHRGGRRRRRIPSELAARMHAFCAEQGVTPFMTALTALGAVLRRQTGKRDFLIGTPASNRPTPHTEQLIGCFANTLVLRVRPQGSATMREAVRQVRDDVVASYDHQDVPFEKVVGRLRPERTLSRNPLFQVMFVYQQVPETDSLPGFAVERFDLHNGTAKFDLDLSLLDGPDGIDVSCEYDAEVFTLSVSTPCWAIWRTPSPPWSPTRTRCSRRCPSSGTRRPPARLWSGTTRPWTFPRAAQSPRCSPSGSRPIPTPRPSALPRAPSPTPNWTGARTSWRAYSPSRARAPARSSASRRIAPRTCRSPCCPC